MAINKAFPNVSILAVFQIAIIALLVMSCLRVIQPFLGALTWASIIAISAWPLHCRLRQKLGERHKLAALLIVLALALALAIPIGLMALTLADTLPHLSGLTHDLTQLTLGLDRDSGLVASLFDERDPAVKTLLAMAIAAANKKGKYVGICGQGPSDHPDLAVWLMEQNITSISLNPDTVVDTWLRLAGQGQ